MPPLVLFVQRQNLWKFMREKLGVEEPQEVWRPLFKKYNQTAKALRCDSFRRAMCRWIMWSVMVEALVHVKEIHDTSQLFFGHGSTALRMPSLKCMSRTSERVKVGPLAPPGVPP